MEGKNIVLTKKGESIENIAPNTTGKSHCKRCRYRSEGEPIIGANVVEKVLTNGCITDMDGKFTLNAPS